MGADQGTGSGEPARERRRVHKRPSVLRRSLPLVGRRRSAVALALAAAVGVMVPALSSDSQVVDGLGLKRLIDATGLIGSPSSAGTPTQVPIVAATTLPDPGGPIADPSMPADPTTPPSPSEPPATDPGHDVPVGDTLFGSSLGLANGGNVNARLHSTDDELGRVPVVRIFNAALPAPWSQREILADRTVVVSFKARPQDVVAGLHDDRLRDWFETAPGGNPVYWTYFHEPEDDIERGAFTAEEFRSAWRHVRELADDAGNPNLHATLVLMGWSVNRNSDRDWRDYYPGDDVIDVMGWDNYNWGYSNDRYATPEEIYSRVIEISDQLGKPWGIAETGTRLLAGDDGTDRAEWLSQVGEFLADRGALWATYFNSTVGGDFRLTDTPSQQAWRELVEASHPLNEPD
jgi:hypothetical protein